MKTILSAICSALLFSNFFAQDFKSHFDYKPYVKGEMLVQVDSKTSIRQVMSQLPGSFNARIKEELSAPMRVWLIAFDSENVSENLMQRSLYSISGVTVADYNYFIQMRSTIPGDPSFTSQWHHVNTGQTGGTSDADIDSDLAWDITTGGTTATGDDIVVCMVEGGGGNLNHQDLSPNRWINTGEIPGNGIDDDGNGYIDDYNGWNTGANNDNTGTGGHGTNCLGMIGAKGDNDLNVVGANWDVKLLVVNMPSSTSQSEVIKAYTYPLILRKMWNESNGTQGAFVVATSASWGVDGADPSNYPLWCQFYDTLGIQGILNIGATTNSNLNVDVSGDMPTACSSPYMIGVGRTDHNDNTAGGYGVETIDLGAPGINVVTTNGTTGITTTTGTSFACPLTAGVVGLAYSIPCTDFMNYVKANPQFGADLVRNALLSGVDPKTQLASKFITGGRLNAKGTLDNLMTAACTPGLCVPPGMQLTSSITETSAEITWNTYAEASSSTLFYREVGSSTWIEISNATSPYTISDLEGCTYYEYYLESVCDTETSEVTYQNTFRTKGCGDCVELPYCNNMASDATDEWIQSFKIGNYTNVSGSDGGYGNYYETGSIDINIGMFYEVTITPGWSGSLYDEYSRIWIDLDRNGSFDESELLFDQGTATQSPATGGFTIPEFATEGIARMRVQMAYQGSGQGTLPSVCGTYTWGEVEDYCVNLRISGAGINSVESQAIKAYPNPATTEVTFELGSIDSDWIVIRNMNGQLIRKIAIDSELMTVDLNGLSNGFYFYEVLNNNEKVLFTNKLILSK